MTPSPTRFGLILVCGLLGTVSASAGEPPPMLRLNFTDGSPTEIICLDSAPATVRIENSDTVLDVMALPECPPADIVAINAFNADSDPTDGVAAGTNIQFDVVEDINNCTIGGQPRTCVFFTWDTVVGFNIDTPTCSISQKNTPIMDPSFVTNPGANSPAEPALLPNYVEDLASPGLAWPILNPGALTAGTSLVYRMNCTGGQTSTVTVNFVDGTTSTVSIDSFNITQTSAQQGTSINFSYSLSFQNSPSNPSCTLSSPGVINTLTLTNVTAGNSADTITLRNDASTGTQTFTFSCRPDSGTPPTDSATDTVNVTQADTGGGTCPSTIPGTNISRDVSQTMFSDLYDNDPGDIQWPGQWGISDATNQRLTVQRGQYKALRFNTNTAASDELRGRFEWGKSGVGGLPQTATYTITTDCADFTPVDPTCRRYSAANRIPWHFSDSSSPEPGSCLLQRNTTYYLNVIYDDTADGLGNSTCPSGSCNHLINAGGGPPTFPN